MEWQDISTAPKDGTMVDLWHCEYGRFVDTWFDSDDGVWVCLGQVEGFTHWSPVPDPPK